MQDVSVGDVYIEIHTDDPQWFRLRMELTLREEYWIKFCMYLVAVVFIHKYCSQFYYLCMVQ
jgi:hypothetical protein